MSSGSRYFAFSFSALRSRLASHSFPTRRSSDLRRSLLRLLLRLSPQVGLSPARPADSPCRGVDRKSTRLNSSHVKISYAVFCLKKKKFQLNSTISPIHMCLNLAARHSTPTPAPH